MQQAKRTEDQIFKEIACAVEALEDKKAENVRVLDVRGKSSVTDFLILATGISEPHLKALRRSLEVALKEAKVDVIGQERETSSGWLIADAFDFMVHLQVAEMREFYRLDALWKDAPEIDADELARLKGTETGSSTPVE